MKPNYRKTMYACFIGYIVQAIVNNFVPLLFVTFQKSYAVPLSKITLLITINFLIQLVVDFVSANLVDKIGYRISIAAAHICAALGLVLLAFLPDLCKDPFPGLLIAVFFYAVGGGLLEVLVSPIIENCPTDNKESSMSLLHSFYCWGQVGVVLLSTLFFALFGIANWRILALCWALVPICNLILFQTAPLYCPDPAQGTRYSLRTLFANRLFWVLLLMMLCAGASEQSVSQWASAFAEKGLGVSKTVGDLAGPMAFAALMGISRTIYGKFGSRINLDRFMQISCLLCIASYLWIALIPSPVVGLFGCALCGFSVGIMWPGSFSRASAAMQGGSTAMFAYLALAGDLGCSVGPSFSGFVSSLCGDNLRLGTLAAIIFPILMFVSLLVCTRLCQKQKAT